MKLRKTLIYTISSIACAASTISISSCAKTKDWSQHFVEPTDADLKKTAESGRINAEYTLILKEKLIDKNQSINISLDNCSTNVPGVGVKVYGKVLIEHGTDVRFKMSFVLPEDYVQQRCTASFSLNISCVQENTIVWEEKGLKGFELIADLPEPYKDLFEIQDGVVKGFNSKLTPQQIEEKVNSNMYLPSYGYTIDDNAFFKNNESTIPSKVKTITVSEWCLLSKIGKNAFKNAPISQIVINNDVQEIDSEAFSGLTSLKNIVLSNIGSSGIPSKWASDAFVCSSNGGNIQIDYEWLEDTTKEKFSGFISKEWTVTSVKKLLNITKESGEVILNGFDPTLTSTERWDAFRFIGDTLTIPSDVTKVAADAFIYEERDHTVDSTIPYIVKVLDFPSDSKCKEIGTRAFMYSPDMAMEKHDLQKIILPGCLEKIGYAAFHGNSAGGSIREIDVSNYTSTEYPHGWVQGNNWYYATEEGIIWVNSATQVPIFEKYFADDGLGMRIQEGKWKVQIKTI
ncbi:MAG: leucine-rich repeat protein [Mycoplasma sp.]|nr:leucine-rich repeat protein [Candidatus Hennigella equi]